MNYTAASKEAEVYRSLVLKQGDEEQWWWQQDTINMPPNLNAESADSEYE